MWPFYREILDKGLMHLQIPTESGPPEGLYHYFTLWESPVSKGAQFGHAAIR